MAITPLGGPTALIELGGLRLLTDPTFDEPGTYPVGERWLTKSEGPALRPEQLGPVDAVLLSHDQHPDNLDHRGRRLLLDVPLTLTTPEASRRLEARALGLVPWTHRDLTAPGGGTVRITAVPARHGPAGTEHLTGSVTGFLVTGVGMPTVYISGDNASLDTVADIAQRTGGVDVAVIFAGAARTALLPDAHLTLTSEQAAVATLLLGRPCTVVLHTDGWDHFTENAATLQPAFARAGVAEQLTPAVPGRRLELGTSSRTASARAVR